MPPHYSCIAYPERIRNLGRSGKGVRGVGFDENYSERMKVSAAIFVFLVFLISSGVWLLDGLRQAFGR
jgi:hypothetical protein